MEFLPEGVGEFQPHFFRAGNGHAQGGQVLPLQAPDVFPNERGRTDDQCDAVLPAEFANRARLQRVGVKRPRRTRRSSGSHNPTVKPKE